MSIQGHLIWSAPAGIVQRPRSTTLDPESQCKFDGLHRAAACSNADGEHGLAYPKYKGLSHDDDNRNREVVQHPEGLRLHSAGQWRLRRLRAHQRGGARWHEHAERGPEGRIPAGRRSPERQDGSGKPQSRRLITVAGNGDRPSSGAPPRMYWGARQEWQRDRAPFLKRSGAFCFLSVRLEDLGHGRHHRNPCGVYRQHGCFSEMISRRKWYELIFCRDHCMHFTKSFFERKSQIENIS